MRDREIDLRLQGTGHEIQSTERKDTLSPEAEQRMKGWTARQVSLYTSRTLKKRPRTFLSGLGYLLSNRS